MCEENKNSGFSRLFKNLVDSVKEAQIKIGYSPTPVAFYYPLDSLCALLGESVNESEMQKRLEDFSEYAEDKLGTLNIRIEDERFRIEIPVKGVECVHGITEGYEFLEEFVKAVSAPCTIESLLEVFGKYSENVQCVKVDGEEEFEYVVYFGDGVPDNYYYCILPEMGHATYHRFTPEDYKSFGF